MSGGTRPRLPNMDDDRFLEGGPELTFDFLTVYQISGRYEPKGTFPEPETISILLIGDTSLTAYYAAQVERMKALGLVGFDDEGRWCIPDYREWNPEWDDPAERMRAHRERQAVQQGLPLPSKSRKPELLTARQLARFERLRDHYPREGWGITSQAKRAFRALNPDDEEMGDILAGIDVWRGSPEWLGGRIHHMRTFIKDRMWEDKPKADRPYPHANGYHKRETARIDSTLDALEQFKRGA